MPHCVLPHGASEAVMNTIRITVKVNSVRKAMGGLFSGYRAHEIRLTPCARGWEVQTVWRYEGSDPGLDHPDFPDSFLVVSNPYDLDYNWLRVKLCYRIDELIGKHTVGPLLSNGYPMIHTSVTEHAA